MATQRENPELQLTGRVTDVLVEVTGEGRNGTWRKQEFVLETQGDYPKKVCIVQWGDAIDKSNVQPGDLVTAHIGIQSREYKGRWFTEVQAWKVERPRAKSAKSPTVAAPAVAVGYDDNDPLF